MIKKQTNYLINEIKRSKFIEDKLIGCASIILVGLCYKDERLLILWFRYFKKNF